MSFEFYIMSDFTQIGYTPIFGRPLIAWLGIATLLSFLTTASIAILGRRGKIRNFLPFHMRMAYFSLALALIHGFLVLLAAF